ncbi:hypothetical protein GO755_16790 [Spirosoma sp. HMF4905]|uniref:DUF4386 domain-containing protein n=1 Tax=Spirosoma arboris TaxID=2682092 RepID=A0A7K1SD11_9BACT|nr:hypothetical protein [Spirosoma arboris]MVM31707.1 hypothetical protein [Spirosoma arboris]
MKKKIVLTLAALVLIILPFLIGNSIGNYSPYVEANSFQVYVLIWAIISIALTSIALLLLKYYPQSFERIGILLFLLICPILGIIGLVKAPDLSLKMLEHPEREHLRYTFLFIAALLFGVFILFLFRSSSLTIKKSTRWIMIAIFTYAFAEFIWEFNHHYSYPEALKEWISQGKNAEAFVKSYDNSTIITIGVIGRFCQFIAIIWLSVYLYRLRQINIWSPILSVFLSLLGIITATVVYITEFNFPKGFEFLMLFFIPGIPFLVLYWIGVAVLTRFRKSRVAV